MSDEANVRVGHFSPDAPNVDVRVNGEIAFEDLGFEEVTEYADLPTGSHDVSVAPHGSEETVLEVTLELEANTSYSAFATGEVGDQSLGCSVFVDEPGDIADDQTHVRFIHTSPDAPAVNVQVADGGPVLCEEIGFREASGYVPVDAGSYDLEVVPSGGSDPALSLPDTAVTAGTAVSAIAVGKLEDGSLGALFAEDAA
jgi:hypothetical protein